MVPILDGHKHLMIIHLSRTKFDRNSTHIGSSGIILHHFFPKESFAFQKNHLYLCIRKNHFPHDLIKTQEKFHNPVLNTN